MARGWIRSNLPSGMQEWAFLAFLGVDSDFSVDVRFPVLGAVATRRTRQKQVKSGARCSSRFIPVSCIDDPYVQVLILG